MYYLKVLNIKDDILTVKIDKPLNKDYLKLVSANSPPILKADVLDTRVLSTEQRKLIYSLIRDISNFTGYLQEETKSILKIGFEEKTGIENISFSDCSKTDAKLFINYLIDLVIELKIPLKKRYKYLLEDNYFYYKCLVNRVCCVCGKTHADIAHVETVGMGRDRRHIDHEKHSFMSLCREHHVEQHKIGISSFISKYHIIPVRLTTEDIHKLKI